MHNPAKGRFRPGIGPVIVLLHVVVAHGVHHRNINAMAGAGGRFVCSQFVGHRMVTRYFTHGAFQCGEGVKYVLVLPGRWPLKGRWISGVLTTVSITGLPTASTIRTHRMRTVSH